MRREHYTPRDLFDEVKEHLILVGGLVSGDDSVLDQPYSDPQKTALMGYFWSGKPKRTVKGINLISLYDTDVIGTSYPVNFRIDDKREGKTKNESGCDRVAEVQAWGLPLAWVTGDSWYAGIENLKLLRHEKVGFLFGIAANRLVALERGRSVQVQT